MIGRLLARRYQAPASLWVVPAILPFLPGLQIVTAMLAESDVERIVGLITAVGTAFVIGTGVASGDIVVATLRLVRDEVIPQALEAAAGGLDTLVVTPFERISGRTTARRPADDGTVVGSAETEAARVDDADDAMA